MERKIAIAIDDCGLAQSKIEARERLLAMPPEDAQKLVNTTLYPQYWSCDSATFTWCGSLDLTDEVEKWVKFAETRLPQIATQIDLKRQKYKGVMEQIEINRLKLRDKDTER